MKMMLKYICIDRGQGHLEAESFIDMVTANDFDGIEINLPGTGMFSDCFIYEIEDIFERNPDFIFISQQLTNPGGKKIEAYIKSMEKRLLQLVALHPSFIHAHTGKDYFSFDDNRRAIEDCMNTSSKKGVRILHETHRGWVSFHAATLLPYLKKFPVLNLVAAFSHFCTVPESLPQDQEEIIQQIIPHVSHIRARVGHEQSPQVSTPFAPVWQYHLNCFAGWWQDIICYKTEQGWKNFTIAPELGQFSYMPPLPFTQQLLNKQRETNSLLIKKLKETLI